MKNFVVAFMMGSFVLPAIAVADEQTSVLAISGQWSAIAYRTSLDSAPILCGAADQASGLVFRTDEDRTTIRAVNQKWSLPANVSGEITLAVGDWTRTAPIIANTHVMVEVVMSRSDMAELIARMDKAPSMKLTVGKEVTTISLAGSTRVTDAYRTCAGIEGNSALPGANPFR